MLYRRLTFAFLLAIVVVAGTTCNTAVAQDTERVFELSVVMSTRSTQMPGYTGLAEFNAQQLQNPRTRILRRYFHSPDDLLRSVDGPGYIYFGTYGLSQGVQQPFVAFNPRSCSVKVWNTSNYSGEVGQWNDDVCTAVTNVGIGKAVNKRANILNVEITLKWVDRKPTYILWPNDEHISPGTGFTSFDGRFMLMFQLDGNLVLYKGTFLSRENAIWSSNTHGNPNTYMVMQSDGNLVIYNNADGRAIWSAEVSGYPNAYLRIQDDGNVVIYESWPPRRENALWSTGTGGCCDR